MVLSVFAKSGPRAGTPRSMSRETGQPRRERGLLGGRFGTGCGRATVRRCGSPLARFTWRARRPRRSETGIWTGPYAPANAPPGKCSPLEKPSARDMQKTIRGIFHVDTFAAFTRVRGRRVLGR